MSPSDNARTTRRLALALALLWALTASPGALAQPADEVAEGESSNTLASERARLIDEYGYGEATLAHLPSILVARAHLEAKRAAVGVDRDVTRLELVELGGSRRVLEEQLQNNTLPRKLRAVLVIQLSHERLEHAYFQTRAEQLEQASAAMRAEAELLTSYHDALSEHELARARREEAERLEREQREEAERLALERKRELEAERLARAERDLEEIKARQLQARDQQQRKLLAEQQRLAERILALTNSRPEREAALEATEEREAKAFANRRDQLNVFLDQLPSELSVKKRREEVDPVFARVKKERRETREAYFELLDAIAAAQDQLAQDEDALRDAKQRLEEAEEQQRSGETLLGTRRLELAQTRVKLEQLERDLSQLELSSLEQRLALKKERLDFFEQEIELLLPSISEDARDHFYSLARDENWEDARVGLRLAVLRATEHVTQRVNQALGLLANPFSISLWAWVGGFLMRLFFSMLAIWAVRRHGQHLIRSLTEQLLKRRFFRQRPTFTIKSSEVLRHILGPLTLLAVITLLLLYGRGVLPELRYAQWVVNAIFIFRLTTIIVSVMILPRTVREPEKLVQRFDEEQAAEGVDVFSLEINRARKLVRSAKVIIWFWLIFIYVPELVVALMGHSVIWRIVDVATTWSFILVIYSVLSTWRDDIARLFESLATERMAPAVEFVNDNKDRIWGVLVIGGASTYVIGRETMRLGRRYLVETEWSKRINNFIFRKKIELQQRDRAAGGEEQRPNALQLAALPSGYRDYFEDHPLLEEVYMVDRHEKIAEDILKRYVEWKAAHRQGSVALFGETGVGKTTIINQVSQRLVEACEGTEAQIVCSKLFDKLTSRRELLSFVASLFDLERAFETKAELIAALMCEPEHVIVLDDCHHLFLRHISGFEAMELFLEIVNLTDGAHYWVLTFDKFAWSYLTRVKRREHYFGAIIPVEPWSEAEIQALIWTRNLMTGCNASFTDLVVAREEGEDFSYEVIKSAKGYFRLLHEFSRGNPRVAMLYWLRSLKPGEDDTIQVGLFRSPPQRVTQALADNYWFTLTAIAQHSALRADEIARVINTDAGFCEMALNYFEEMDIVLIDPRGRARLAPLYFRQVLKYLTDSNYLYE